MSRSFLDAHSISKLDIGLKLFMNISDFETSWVKMENANGIRQKAVYWRSHTNLGHNGRPSGLCKDIFWLLDARLNSRILARLKNNFHFCYVMSNRKNERSLQKWVILEKKIWCHLQNRKDKKYWNWGETIYDRTGIFLLFLFCHFLCDKV